MALPEGRLVHVEFVGIDRALHDVLAQPVDAGDEYDIAEAGLGIQCEDHAARGPVGSHHLHDSDRERDLEMVEAIVDSIGNGAIGEDGGEAAPAGFEQIPRTADVEEAFVLACKARGREILGRGRAAHGNRDVGPIFAFELSIGRGDFLLEGDRCRWHRRRCPGLRRHAWQAHRCGSCRPHREAHATGPMLRRRQRIAVGLGREGEAVRHSDAPTRQSRIELTKGSVLSTHCRNIVQPNVAEPAHVPGSRHSRSLIYITSILLRPCDPCVDPDQRGWAWMSEKGKEFSRSLA